MCCCCYVFAPFRCIRCVADAIFPFKSSLAQHSRRRAHIEWDLHFNYIYWHSKTLVFNFILISALYFLFTFARFVLLAYDSLLCHTALVPLMMMIWSTKCNSDTRYRYRCIELFSHWPFSAPSQHIYSTSQLFLFPFTLLTFWFLSTIFIIRLQSPTMIFFAQRFYSLERLIHCSECRIFYATHFLFLSYW